MGELVADFVLERLREWGVHRVFGYPGDGINGFLGAFDRADGDPEFIQARHEEMAAFMACGHAKFTGEIGVCIATSGPGRDPPPERPLRREARPRAGARDRRPAEADVARRRATSRRSICQTLFKDVSEYVQTCMDPAQARHLVDRAIRTALDRARRRDARSSRTTSGGEGRRVAAARARRGLLERRLLARRGSLPTGPTSTRAAEILNERREGRDPRRPGRARRAPTRSSRPPRCSAPASRRRCSARPCSPDDLPFVTGSIGLLGTTAELRDDEGCDTLLMVGTSFPYSEWLPKEGQARCVEIDLDARMIGMRYPVDVQLVGDAKETLRALLPLLERKEDRGWREQIEANVAEWWRVVERPRARWTPTR